MFLIRIVLKPKQILNPIGNCGPRLAELGREQVIGGAHFLLTYLNNSPMGQDTPCASAHKLQ